MTSSSDTIDGLSTPTDSSHGLPTSSSIEALEGNEHRGLMDLVDKLRRSGLSTLLELPQIVVCGDQSSGKSSVLEAITQIPFPRKENLCTRFATEIVMRRSLETSVSCKINPDDGRTEEEKNKLRAFIKVIADFDELPTLMEEVGVLMGLNDKKAFSRDVLTVEISGPNRPQLTVVDLPGLIHSSTKSQSDDDVELIGNLVRDYISEERTIVLAVISAKNDYANQVILKKCREVDRTGERTLGLITKPDFLLPGSENENAWLDLAQNKDVIFELGWHLMKNRADDEQGLSFEERNRKERLFFSTGRYRELPDEIKGVQALCKRLSTLLFAHLKRELPALKADLDNMAEDTADQLKRLGKSRRTNAEQMMFLLELLTSSRDLIKKAVNGNYDDHFFGPVDVEEEVVMDPMVDDYELSFNI